MCEETYKTDGGFLVVEVDESPESPRTWDNLGKLYIAPSRNTIDHNEMDLAMDSSDFENEEEFRTYMEKEFDAFVLPVYRYEHSAVAYNTTGFACNWDSGQVGYIIAEKKQVREEWKVKRISKKLRENVYSILEGEIENYSQWANGDIYGFTLYKDEEKEEELDSCWGFYGTDMANNGLLHHAGVNLID